VTETTAADVASWFEAAIQGQHRRAKAELPRPVYLERIAGYVNDARRFRDDLLSNQVALSLQADWWRSAQQAASQLIDLLPKLVASFEEYPPRGIVTLEPLTTLESALRRAAPILGEPAAGRPAELWESFAPYLLGFINGAAGDKLSYQRKIAVFCDALRAIDGVERDVQSVASVLKRSREKPGAKIFRVSSS
jgi:hypothetical protein